MRAIAIAPLIFAFALAGCGEEQSATNSKGPPGPAETATLPQPDPNRPAEPARPPEAGGGGAVTQGPGSQPDSIRNAPARSLDTTNLTGALPPPGGGRDTGAELQAMMDRTYSAGQVSIRFDRDNNFTMRDTATGREVKGPFAYMDGVVTFLEPQSADTGVARFPMRCRVERRDGESFALADPEGSCGLFRDMTFRPAG